MHTVLMGMIIHVQTRGGIKKFYSLGSSGVILCICTVCILSDYQIQAYKHKRVCVFVEEIMRLRDGRLVRC